MRLAILAFLLCLFIGAMTPCEAGESETVICPECGIANPAGANYCSACGAEPPRPMEDALPNDGEPYSWGLALVGNLLPGLGYFLIDEPWWGVAELGIIGASTALVIVGAEKTGFMEGLPELVLGFSFMSFAWLGGLIHAPLLAVYKNDQLGYSLELEPGLYLAEEGELRPGLRLSFVF